MVKLTPLGLFIGLVGILFIPILIYFLMMFSISFYNSFWLFVGISIPSVLAELHKLVGDENE